MKFSVKREELITVNLIMRLFFIPLALYSGFLTYMIFMLFFGPNGVYAFARLNDNIQLLAENMELLNSRKAELTQTLNSLRSDSNEIRIKARGIGLYEPGQHVVYFQNLEDVQTLPDAGQVLVLDSERKVDQRFFRILSFIVSLLFFIVGFVLSRVGSVSHQKQT